MPLTLTTHRGLNNFAGKEVHCFKQTRAILMAREQPPYFPALTRVSTLVARGAHLTPSKAHIALPLLLMAILYWLSSLPGIPLSEDDVYYDLFRWVAPSVQNALHVPAYAALTLAWRWALGAWLRSPSACVLSACAIASACGVLDEWHQSFVPGRFAAATDVMLDFAGVALGIWIAAWIGSRVETLKPQANTQEGGT